MIAAGSLVLKPVVGVGFFCFCHHVSSSSFFSFFF
jgi:hypothetical protein